MNTIKLTLTATLTGTSCILAAQLDEWTDELSEFIEVVVVIR